ncbi:MAG: exosortase system-associated protein, TIGR04073 family [Lentisphaeria bacterium]|nr:exosortase system-associated protein, TIGR04073 family [Lentisphaeria bacterium]
MMKTIRLFVFSACGFLALSALPASAANEVIDNMIRQFGRGVNNVATGLLEVPANVVQVQEEDGPLAALSYGVTRGVFRCVVREVVGVFEICTFPAGFKPIVAPEFGGAPGILQDVFEPDMRQSTSAYGEWKICPLERPVTK